jgi:hypothetical protein
MDPLHKTEGMHPNEFSSNQQLAMLHMKIMDQPQAPQPSRAMATNSSGLPGIREVIVSPFRPHPIDIGRPFPTLTEPTRPYPMDPRQQTEGVLCGPNGIRNVLASPPKKKRVTFAEGTELEDGDRSRRRARRANRVTKPKPETLPERLRSQGKLRHPFTDTGYDEEELSDPDEMLKMGLSLEQACSSPYPIPKENIKSVDSDGTGKFTAPQQHSANMFSHEAES